LAPSSGTTNGAGQFTATATSTVIGSKVFSANITPGALNATVTFTAPVCVGQTLNLPEPPCAFNVPAAGNPFRMVSGDFNGDGKLDVATLGAGRLSLLFGVGNGTFAAPATHFVTGNPT